MNLCKLFPRDEPGESQSPFVPHHVPLFLSHLLTSSLRTPRTDAEDENDFDAGDRGSFFHFFTEQVDADGLASMLWQDILPNCVAYFEGNGQYHAFSFSVALMRKSVN